MRRHSCRRRHRRPVKSKLLQETQLQQGVKLPRQVQLRQTVQSSNELPSASEPQSQRESQPAEAASVPSEKDLHIQSAACPEKKEPAFFPFGEPFFPFPEGDLSACWKIQPQDLVHFPRDNACFETTAFYSMAITISVICCYAKELMVVTYWECREAMTSRNSLWQECLGSPVLKKVL